MKILRLKVDGYRCLQKLDIQFDPCFTVLIGENDCGKTSILNCLNIITDTARSIQIEADDFHYDKNTIEIEIETENFTYHKTFTRDEDDVTRINSNPLIMKPTREWVEKKREEIDAFDCDIENSLLILQQMGQEVATVNVNRYRNVENLKTELLHALEGEEIIFENGKFPNFNNIPLDGKHFENIPSFFQRLFLLEREEEIWNEEIPGDTSTTLKEFIGSKINDYTDEINKQIEETGVTEELRVFLKDLTKVQISTNHQIRGINLDPTVEFLENGNAINIDKKGDGTKRRITMALLEMKKKQQEVEADKSTLYLLDEPDTHLHVRAQLELLSTFRGFSQLGNQVIMTTHSPFILNAMLPSQIRLICQNRNNETYIRQLGEASISQQELESLGIENVYLFFAKYVILVEGETEEEFFKTFFLKTENQTTNSAFIKVINAGGIQNIHGFANGITQVHEKESIFVVYDNDESEDVTKLIQKLEISEDQLFVIGNSEFEDAFSNQALFSVWQTLYEEREKDLPPNWTIEKIQEVREECALDPTKKFSKKLKVLNSGGMTKMSKPDFGRRLANNVSADELPEELKDLFRKIGVNIPKEGK